MPYTVCGTSLRCRARPDRGGKSAFLGDWHGVLKITEEALYAAQRSGMTSRIVGGRPLGGSGRLVLQRRRARDCRKSAPRGLRRRGGTSVCSAVARRARERRSRSPSSRSSNSTLASRRYDDDFDQARSFDEAIAGIDTVENVFCASRYACVAALLLPPSAGDSRGSRDRADRRIAAAASIAGTPHRFSGAGRFRHL